MVKKAVNEQQQQHQRNKKNCLQTATVNQESEQQIYTYGAIAMVI